MADQPFPKSFVWRCRAVSSAVTFVTMYTPGTSYEKAAADLELSLARHGRQLVAEPIADRGSWVENCAQKAEFIAAMRERLAGPLCWLDADALAHRDPQRLYSPDCDFAAVFRDGWNLHGGQLLFADCDRARSLIGKWRSYSAANPRIWDQVTLGYAWWDLTVDGALRTRRWPDRAMAKLSRSWPKRFWQRAFSSATILHRQESRRSKSAQQRVRVDEFRSDDIPGWWRVAAQANDPFLLSRDQTAELFTVPTGRSEVSG